MVFAGAPFYTRQWRSGVPASVEALNMLDVAIASARSANSVSPLCDDIDAALGSLGMRTSANCHYKRECQCAHDNEQQPLSSGTFGNASLPHVSRLAQFVAFWLFWTLSEHADQSCVAPKGTLLSAYGHWALACPSAQASPMAQSGAQHRALARVGAKLTDSPPLAACVRPQFAFGAHADVGCRQHGARRGRSGRGSSEVSRPRGGARRGPWLPLRTGQAPRPRGGARRETPCPTRSGPWSRGGAQHGRNSGRRGSAGGCHGSEVVLGRALAAGAHRHGSTAPR